MSATVPAQSSKPKRKNARADLTDPGWEQGEEIDPEKTARCKYCLLIKRGVVC